MTAAVQIVKNRIIKCESANALRNRDLSSCTWLEVQAYVNSNKALWSLFPPELQVRVAFRGVEETLSLAYASMKKGDQKATAAGFQGFAQSLSLIFEGDTVDKPKYKGCNTSLADVVELIVHLKDQCALAQSAPKFAMSIQDHLKDAELTPQQSDLQAACQARCW